MLNLFIPLSSDDTDSRVGGVKPISSVNHPPTPTRDIYWVVRSPSTTCRPEGGLTARWQPTVYKDSEMWFIILGVILGVVVIFVVLGATARFCQQRHHRALLGLILMCLVLL